MVTIGDTDHILNIHLKFYSTNLHAQASQGNSDETQYCHLNLDILSSTKILETCTYISPSSIIANETKINKSITSSESMNQDICLLDTSIDGLFCKSYPVGLKNTNEDIL